MQKIFLASVICCLSVSTAQAEMKPLKSDERCSSATETNKEAPNDACRRVEEVKNLYKHSLYIGAMGGYGSTTWQGLVPQGSNQNVALSMSTPIAVQEGGGVWGLVAGYEFTPCFALEANYMHFPDAKLEFDPDSLFSFENNGLTALSTQTQTGSLNAKVMLILPRTNMRVFSSAGVASIIRKDDINEINRISPVFGFGVNLLLNDRIMAELGSNYIAGYGESEINPVNDFVPFLYSIFGKIVVRF